MGIKFIGQFLLEKNIIKPEQLIEAVEYQESKRLKFGDYALSKGYLTEKNIAKIQAEQRHTDMRFGELAVKLNILTPAQVDEILTLQKNDHILIGQALIEKGFIRPEVLERELALFKADQSKFVSEGIMVPSGAANPDIIKDMVDLTQKMLLRLAQMTIKLGNGYISNKEPEKNYLLVSVYLFGSLKYHYAVSASLEASRLVASKIIGEEVKKDNREAILDGEKEFCNITCGNIIAKMAQRGKAMDISPPMEINYSGGGYSLVKGGNAVYYPMASPEGNITLILVPG
ncbi:MAG: chemotaxis protein CheX [Nitrospirae bacterium]|nr:chemotaxis protein CheX [Nitrospirota bacterium]MBI4838061.1 chemotaxis protein CheX [Nitrospirota bacterium]